MVVTSLDLPEVKVVDPTLFADARGFFFESYSHRHYATAGMDAVFVQDNHSRSVRGTVRGLHYQLLPGQVKLVRAVVGSVLDVVVDIRKGSPRYGRWASCELSADNKRQLYVPVGFAHGFCVLSDVAEVAYKVNSYYAPTLERGIRYNDPAIGVQWPVREPILSARDQALPALADADCDFMYAALA